MIKDLLLRSFMFVPAYNKRFIEKGLASNTDALIMDVEDSVPSEHRAQARENLRECFENRAFFDKRVFIRINEIGTADFIEDIRLLIHEDVTGFMPSKIRSAEDIRFLHRLFAMAEIANRWHTGRIQLAPLIETTEAVADIQNIAHACERLCALCFGGEDYLDDLGSSYTHMTPAFAYPRSAISIAARSAGILPIDTPYLELEDIEGFMREERDVYKMGFAGCLLINPKQIAPANEAFSPSAEEFEWAKGVCATIEQAYNEKGSGIAVYEGTMIGPPMRKRAERVLKLQRLIENGQRTTQE